MAKVEIYSKDGCVNCDLALAFLDDVQMMGFAEIDTVDVVKAPADRNSTEYEDFVQRVRDRIAACGDDPRAHKSFPFVWVDNSFVGGLAGLKRSFMRKGKRTI
jgi:glutaredoxin